MNCICCEPVASELLALHILFFAHWAHSWNIYLAALHDLSVADHVLRQDWGQQEYFGGSQREGGGGGSHRSSMLDLPCASNPLQLGEGEVRDREGLGCGRGGRGGDLAALHDLSEVGGFALRQEVELADVLGGLAKGASDAVHPHLRHQHALPETQALLADCT